jgi:hypothetical protein
MDRQKRDILESAGLSGIALKEFEERDEAIKEAGITKEYVDETVDNIRQRLEREPRKSLCSRLYDSFCRYFSSK